MSATVQIEKKPHRGGRPRSEATRQSILNATFALLGRSSVQSITIEAIAREAGVSKATIYRWWSSKASVVIDAFIENHIVNTPIDYDLHPAEALVRHWRSIAEHYRGESGRIVAQILAEGQADPAILQDFRHRFHSDRRAVVRRLVAELYSVHKMPFQVDNEVFMDMLYSGIYMRLLWGHMPIDDQFVRDYPLAVFNSIGIHFDDQLRIVCA